MVSAARLCLSVLVFFASLAVANAQQPSAPERDLGLQLYKQGDFNGAIHSLQEAIKHNKDDVSAWHYLAEALAQQGKSNDALKAHEKAAKIAEEQAGYLLDRQAIYSDKPISLPRAQLIEGAQSAEQYLALSNKSSSRTVNEWTKRARFLRALGSDATGFEVFSGREVTTKVRILSKPTPSYTEEARGHQVNGRVILTALFGPDGQVHAIRVMKGLPDGLTRAAIEATQRIKFVAATKDGRAVSQWLEVEYGFNIY